MRCQDKDTFMFDMFQAAICSLITEYTSVISSCIVLLPLKPRSVPWRGLDIFERKSLAPNCILTSMEQTTILHMRGCTAYSSRSQITQLWEKSCHYLNCVFNLIHSCTIAGYHQKLWLELLVALISTGCCKIRLGVWREHLNTSWGTHQKRDWG